jgi:hypothetical protein
MTPRILLVFREIYLMFLRIHQLLDKEKSRADKPFAEDKQRAGGPAAIAGVPRGSHNWPDVEVPSNCHSSEGE